MIKDDGEALASADEPTGSLIVRIREGDDSARDMLFRRYLPLLRRWAHGRLPTGARDLAQTDYLVQITLMRALINVAGFDARSKGSFLAYLRQILLNEVRAEIRRVRKLPERN